MKRRKLTVPLAVLAVAIAIAAAVILRKTAPPEPIRLLPEADGYIYLNLGPLRKAGLLEKMPPVQVDPEYDEFVTQTGFQFERDLEEVAIAVHAPPPPMVTGGAAQNLAGENHYSEIFVAHFDGQRLREFLKKYARNTEIYHDREIFEIPRQGYADRVCILGPELVALSTTADPDVIRGIVDRYRRLALPFGGPKLVREHYRTLPFGTLAWVIAQIGHGSAENKALTLPGGFNVFFPPDTVLLGSLRYLGSIDLKVQALTKSEDAARGIADQLSAFLAIFRTLELNAGGPDPDVKKFFDSIKVRQDGAKAELTADLPQGFLKKMLTEPPPEIQSPAPEPEPKKSPTKRHRKRR